MKNERISETLREYRKKNRYSVNEVARGLEEKGRKVAANTIYGWEDGRATPDTDVFLTLCGLYHIRNVMDVFGFRADADAPLLLSPHERALVDSYRKGGRLQYAVDRLLDCKNENGECLNER